MAAAATIRGSVPSGRTIRRTSARAASTSRCRKAAGETRATREACRNPFTHAGSTWSATKFIVLSTRSWSSGGISEFIEAIRVAVR